MCYKSLYILCSTTILQDQWRELHSESFQTHKPQTLPIVVLVSHGISLRTSYLRTPSQNLHRDIKSYQNPWMVGEIFQKRRLSMWYLLLLNVEFLIRIIYNDLFPTGNKLLDFSVFSHSFIDSKDINEIILSKFIIMKILPRIVQLCVIEVNVFKISLFSKNIVDYRAIEESIHCDTLK